MKTLLVAAGDVDRDKVSAIADHEFRVYVASSDREAMSMLSASGIDGVVCCADYNDGNPLELRNLVRKSPVSESLPFIVVKASEGRFPADRYFDVERICAEYHIPYIDGSQLVGPQGEGAGYAELRRLVDAHLH